MPQNRAANDNEPPMMTWGKAMPVLAICLIFDLLGLIFQFFWFFGPIIIGGVAGTWASGWVGGAAGTAVGTATGAVAGFFGGVALGVFGVIMAIAVGFMGWLFIGLLLAVMNHRIFKANEKWLFWVLFGLGVDMVPFVGALPGITGSVTKLYHTQIKQEKAAHRAWQAAHKEQEQRERAERSAQIGYLREARAVRERQGAAANDDGAIPEEVPKAA